MQKVTFINCYIFSFSLKQCFNYLFIRKTKKKQLWRLKMITIQKGCLGTSCLPSLRPERIYCDEPRKPQLTKISLDNINTNIRHWLSNESSRFKSSVWHLSFYMSLFVCLYHSVTANSVNCWWSWNRASWMIGLIGQSNNIQGYREMF